MEMTQHRCDNITATWIWCKWDDWVLKTESSYSVHELVELGYIKYVNVAAHLQFPSMTTISSGHISWY